MTNNLKNSTDLTQLDAQAFANSLKNELRANPYFKDFDFDASNMNLLIQLLGVNSFKNAFYMNMSFAERWLDSAQLRTSLFSHSKTLNYLPRSVQSASAHVKVSFKATGDSQPYVIQKGAPFTTMIKSKSFTFTLPETLIVASANNNFEFETDIYEGIYRKDSYIFQATEFLQRFKISNRNIDTRSLTVTVFEDGKQIGDVYKFASSLLDLKSTSKVFFLQTSETGQYEIIFGDGILGRQPKAGSLIILDYRISNGPEGNGAKSFSVDFDPTSQNELIGTPSIEVYTQGHDGMDAESNDSIKYYAPRHFQVQERGAVEQDYEILLRNQFPEINAITVYGGEKLNPPIMGKVFISVDIADVDGLPDSKVQQYKDFLKGRSIFGIDPIFVEPDFVYLYVSAIVRYNINITSATDNRIKSLVTSTISDYNKINLNDFAVTLYGSVLSTEIDETDVSIISNILEVDAYKKINPRLGIPQNFTLDFTFALKNDVPKQSDTYLSSDLVTVYSSNFTFGGVTCNIEDDGDGTLRIVKTSNDQKIKIIDIGTVDYDNGIVFINGLNIDEYEGNALKVYVVPKDKDITSDKNNIMMIEPDAINITVQSMRV